VEGKGKGRRGREAEGERREGREGEGKGFAGPMSNCFLRACYGSLVVFIFHLYNSYSIFIFSS